MLLPAHRPDLASAPPPVRARLFIPSLPTLDPTLLAPSLEPARRALYPLDWLASGQAQLFYLARAGVHHTIKHWLGGRDEVVLMPAYHHGVEVEAVRAGRRSRRLLPRRSQYAHRPRRSAQKGAGADVRVLYVTHFVGFAQPIVEARQLADELRQAALRGLRAGAVLAHPDGRAARQLRRRQLLLPLQDAARAARRPAGGTQPPRRQRRAPRRCSRRCTTSQAWCWPTSSCTRSGLGRELRRAARAAAHATVDKAIATVKTGTMHLQPHELALGASELVERLLPRFDGEMVVVRRRRNFQRLAAALDGIVPLLGAPLPHGTCPLFLPVRIAGDKRAILHRLQQLGIDAIDFWSTGDPACSESGFPEVAQLRREILELPCHQSLDDEAIDRVAHAVKQVVAHA